MERLFRHVVFSSILALFALPAAAAELIMVEEQGCIWCALWNRELSAIYPKTPEGQYAPLRRIEMAEARSGNIAFVRPIAFTPTFVLIEDGHELSRIEGYPGEDFFWGLLGRMLTDNTTFAGLPG